MDYRPLTQDFAVAGQITPDQIAEIKAAGYRSVICNRPDDEQSGQPSVASVRAAAEAAGLAFRHIPVSGGIFPPDAVAATAAALTSSKVHLRLLPFGRALDHPLLDGAAARRPNAAAVQ